ncbi:MAG: hypothetical protein HQ592_10110 [Planctomycetes bacterium]|nr:hypothetical protein [Planctomycetota bacterium]
MPPKDAVTTARFSTTHHEDSFSPNPDRKQTLGELAGLLLNESIPESVRDDLAGRGHNIHLTPDAIAAPVMLVRDLATGTIHAAGDPKAGRHAAAVGDAE